MFELPGRPTAPTSVSPQTPTPEAGEVGVRVGVRDAVDVGVPPALGGVAVRVGVRVAVAGAVDVRVGVRVAVRVAVGVTAWNEAPSVAPAAGATTMCVAAPPSDQFANAYEVPDRLWGETALTELLDPTITVLVNGAACAVLPTAIWRPDGLEVNERLAVFG
jgi:hypothetical protein